MSLEIKNLSFAYGAYGTNGANGSDDLVLNGLSHSFSPRKLHCLLGTNGSGKTTLLKLIGGLLSPPETALIKLDREALQTSVQSERAKIIAYVGSDLWTEFPYTVRDYLRLSQRIKYNASFRNLSSKEEREIDDATEMMGCQPLANKEIRALSEGQRQLVGVTRGVLQKPRVLLLDEALSKMDQENRYHVVSRIRDEIQNGMMALVVSHDLNFAAEMGDLFHLLVGKKISDSGTAREVLTEEKLQRTYACNDIRVRQTDGEPVHIYSKSLAVKP